jgi:peptide-methionine (S)-S-oxide reductase
MPTLRRSAVFLAALAFSATACTHAAGPSAELPPPKADLPAGKPGEMRTAVFAGGCFWCTEAVFEHVKGVTDVESGYAGGSKETATYEQSNTGRSGHAEAVKITYDASQITYGQLLRIFFDEHEPTRLNAQGPDTGPQYRAAIFYENQDQKRVAEAYIQQLTDAKLFDAPIVTSLEDLTKSGFYRAEEYHQNYAAENPNQMYIQANVPKKLKKLKERHAAFYREREATK